MPLYEYRCRACGHEFEALVRRESAAVCPKCEADDLERLLSSFSVNSDVTREVALKAGRRQLANAEHDKAVERREIIEKHHH